ncbi:triose-phosphate transporter family-domain-containing protein [Infundibulicybe gibba]|nr:triose-phosphate transporter family-domain-containing protein [Infundibulicybe gibba]
MATEGSHVSPLNFMAQTHHHSTTRALPDEPLPPSRISLSPEEDIQNDPYTGDFHIASVAEKKRLWWRNAVINTLFIASWFFFATILSLYNKWMFSPEHFAFPFPLFVTTLHMFVQFGLAAALRNTWPHHFRPERSPTRADYGKKVVPTAMATGLDIGLSNLSLKTITLSFYTMCKSSSLIFVLLFAFLFRLERFSWRLVGVILLIFSGVLLMVATETHFVLEGLILVLSASALGGFRWSLTQVLLKNKTMGLDNPAATVYWLAPAMGLTLAIVSTIVEGWMKIFYSDFFSGIGNIISTLFFLISPGILAFCMVMSEFYILQRAGVVPMSIAGIAKEVTTITIAAWYFGDDLTPLNITGVSITVCGIGLFTFHKYRKSIESTVPLDAHGNPIVPDGDDDDGRYEYQQVELDETTRLNSAPRASGDFGEDELSPSHNPRLIFSAGDGDDDADELRTIHSSMVPFDSEPRSA